MTLESTLFSIGHGDKAIEEFQKELQSFGIAYFVDVRTSPYSKWNADFNRRELQNYLNKIGVKYVYMGDVFGGMPSDPTCYTPEGRVNYAAISGKDFFRHGIERLVVANGKNLRLAVMCSEADPTMCHRAKLSGRELLKRNIEMRHIVGVGKELSQSMVLLKMNNGSPDTDLFGQHTSSSSYSKKASVL